jgi:hypothetical protein
MVNYNNFMAPTWKAPPSAPGGEKLPPMPPMLKMDFVALTENREKPGGYSRKGTNTMQRRQRV